MEEHGLRELGRLLEGRLKTDTPTVTKDIMLNSMRRHNTCLKQMSDGCDLLLDNVDAMAIQQRKVLAAICSL